MAAQQVFLESPQGDEIKEVAATVEALSPLLAAGWHQVPAPAKHETVVMAPKEEK